MRPYIICHMMTSIDGRIDCAMTAKLKGVEDYYTTLEALDTPSTLSGRVTGMLELAEPGEFQAKDKRVLGQDGFSKKIDADGYEIIVDTKGTLLWNEDSTYDKPHLIITSEQVTKEYLSYLDKKNISWIACGKDRIDLQRSVELLGEQFGVTRLAIVGGAHINGGFLDAGLLDEISILIGLGVDGREGMPAVLDGLPGDREPIPIKLKSVEQFEDGAVWLRYSLKNSR